MSNLSITMRGQGESAGFWFVLLACLVFCAEALGFAARLVAGAMPSSAVAWLAMAGVAIVTAGVASVLLNWLLLRPHGQIAAQANALRLWADLEQAQSAVRAEQQRRLRHDIRGALSPALLTADRLTSNADPAVKRAAEIMVRSVDRAAALLIDTPEPVANPLAGL